MAGVTIADLRNKNMAFTKNGGDNAAWALTDPVTGAINSNFATLPAIQKSNLKDETDTPSEKLEGGDLQYFLGDRKANIEFDVLQQDAPTLNFPLTYGGQNMCVVKQMYDRAQPDGKVAFAVVPNAKLDRKFAKDSGSVASKFTWNVMASTTSLTLNLTSITAAWPTKVTCGSYAVPAGTYICVDAL